MHQPVVIDETDTILIGHARTQAAISIEAKTIPTIRRRGMSEADKRLLLLADNRLGEVGSGWDDERLQEELRHLLGANFDLTLTGFDLGEYGREPGEAPPKEPRIAPGETWALGDHRLSCAEPGAWMGAAGAKLALVRYPDEGTPRIDLPGVEQMYILAAPAHDMRGITEAMRSGFEAKAQIIATMPAAKGRAHYGTAHRLLWVAIRRGGKANWRGGRKQSTLWQPEAEKYPHGDLPAELWARAITNHTAPQDRVAIAWAGAGEALCAATSTGRAAEAAEPDPALCERAIARWEGLTGQTASKVSG